MYLIHVHGEDVKTWHHYTSKQIIEKQMKKDRTTCSIHEGHEVKPEWVLAERYLEYGPRGDVRRFCWLFKNALIALARQLEKCNLWDCGWAVRRVSFVFERKVQ